MQKLFVFQPELGRTQSLGPKTSKTSEGAPIVRGLVVAQKPSLFRAKFT